MFEMNMYIDYCLQKGFKYKKEKEIDYELSRITQLFRHLKDKDVFEVHYKQLLAKRLIN